MTTRPHERAHVSDLLSKANAAGKAHGERPTEWPVEGCPECNSGAVRKDAQGRRRIHPCSTCGGVRG